MQARVYKTTTGYEVITSEEVHSKHYLADAPDADISVLNIAGSVVTLNQAKYDAREAAKVTKLALLASTATKKSAREQRLTDAQTNFATLDQAKKDTLLKDLLEDRLGM